jgi:hypothetical protein
LSRPPALMEAPAEPHQAENALSPATDFPTWHGITPLKFSGG